MQYGQKKRNYSVAKKTIDLIGVSNFDECRNKKDLHFTLEKAYKKYQKDLKTKSTDRIKSVIKQGIVRDVRSIIIRNMAIKWREDKKLRGMMDQSEGRNSSLNQTSKSFSPQKSILGGTARGSPSKFSPSPGKRAGFESFRLGNKSEAGNRSEDAKSAITSPAKTQVGFADNKSIGAAPTANKL